MYTGTVPGIIYDTRYIRLFGWIHSCMSCVTCIFFYIYIYYGLFSFVGTTGHQSADHSHRRVLG